MSPDNPIPPAAPTRDPHASSTHPVLIFCAWLLVGVPLLWGVSQTFLKSLDLFRATTAAAATTATTTAATAPALPAPEPQPTPAPR
jgi:hypothetical protein